MPRASWKGFLRLSLVSCPIYLSPATTRTKSIRLHQVWQPRAARSVPIEDEEEEERPSWPARPSFAADIGSDAELAQPPTRVALRPHDPHTGEEIEREEVVKGYEYERGEFATFTAEELKALDAESSKIIDLETFVPRAEIDPIYFNTPYYVYPDGPIADETFGVIGAAMREADQVGIGRVTLSRRERPFVTKLTEVLNAGNAGTQQRGYREKLFVDYAGDTVPVIVDRLSGRTEQRRSLSPPPRPWRLSRPVGGGGQMRPVM